MREAATLRAFVTSGPDPVVKAALNDLAAVTPQTRRDRVAAAMRRAKRVIAMTTAIADIGGIWPLERITGTLSDLAEATLWLAMAHLLRAAHDAGELRLPDPADPTRGGGFTVLGMGKLGARELNYSSDVDLVLLYDPAAPIYTERSHDHAMGGFTSRIARGLVSLMEARDADGYVFRTDLRLRPDPAVTPPAVALPAAITYYESMGQNWERAAMIKARPVAGDLALGASFLEAIRPFVWRRGLDFAAVADIHAMKRRIDEHKGGALTEADDPVARIAGHNVKLGEGGIREIEFLAQTLQLVWGGRDPGLRVPTTLGALRLLVRAGHVPRDAARELAAAYRFLRRVEHRLQMVADRQIHELPERPADLERFATFMGYPDATSFANDLLRHLRQVRARYAEVFELVPELLEPDGAGPELDFSGVDAAPAGTTAALRALGFGNPERIVAAVRGWQAGHVRALRSDARRASCWRRCCRAFWRRWPASRSPTPCSTGSTLSWRASPPACSCCRCSSATRRCSTGLPPCSAPRRRWPTTSPATLPRSMACCRPDETGDPAPLLRGAPARRAPARGRHRDHPPHRPRGRLLPSPSRRWRAGWMPTPPGSAGRRSPMPR